MTGAPAPYLIALASRFVITCSRRSGPRRRRSARRRRERTARSARRSRRRACRRRPRVRPRQVELLRGPARSCPVAMRETSSSDVDQLGQALAALRARAATLSATRSTGVVHALVLSVSSCSCSTVSGVFSSCDAMREELVAQAHRLLRPGRGGARSSSAGGARSDRA